MVCEKVCWHIHWAVLRIFNFCFHFLMLKLPLLYTAGNGGGGHFDESNDCDGDVIFSFTEEHHAGLVPWCQELAEC